MPPRPALRSAPAPRSCLLFTSSYRLGGVGATRLVDRLAIDLAHVRPFGEAPARALGAVRLGKRELDVEQLAGRAGPLDDVVERLPRGHLALVLEVDHRAVEAVPDRAPEVLLDLALAHRLAEQARV